MNPATGQVDYNYQAAGFDGFLSRSIDDLTQVTLDGPGPNSTSQRLDSSQFSGIAGDIFQSTNNQQVGILSGDIILDGTLRIGSNIFLGDRISTGEPAILVSKGDVDVSRATNDELYLNSDQNTFKIAASITQDFPAVTVAGSSDDVSQQYIIPHHLDFVPAFQIYVKIPKPQNAYNSLLPNEYYVAVTNVLQIQDSNSIEYLFYFGVDATNIYLARGIHNFAVGSQTSLATNALIYIQQESASAS